MFVLKQNIKKLQTVCGPIEDPSVLWELQIELVGVSPILKIVITLGRRMWPNTTPPVLSCSSTRPANVRVVHCLGNNKDDDDDDDESVKA